MSGTATPGPEVTNISAHGFWILFDGRELFLPYDDFPWFRKATVEEISELERHGSDHLHWPRLDVDLTIDAIEHPERYPLVNRAARGDEVVMERAAVSSEDEFERVADRIAKRFAKKGISRDDVEAAIRWARRSS